MRPAASPYRRDPTENSSLRLPQKKDLHTSKKPQKDTDLAKHVSVAYFHFAGDGLDAVVGADDRTHPDHVWHWAISMHRLGTVNTFLMCGQGWTSR